jgi:hypothetical protein
MSTLQGITARILRACCQLFGERDAAASKKTYIVRESFMYLLTMLLTITMSSSVVCPMSYGQRTEPSTFEDQDHHTPGVAARKIPGTSMTVSWFSYVNLH